VTKNRKKTESFDIQEFLSSAGTSRSIARFKKGQVIFSQDDPCDDVLYIQYGNAKLSIVNPGVRKQFLRLWDRATFWARAALSVTRYAWPRRRQSREPETIVAKISQETLAELVGTTWSRVNFFMNKFRKLGFIHYNGGLQVHSSLLNVVLYD
jgi:hypothetical protein